MVYLDCSQINRLDYIGSVDTIDGKYYYKQIDRSKYGLELVMERFASLVSLECAHYEIVKTPSGIEYYFSKDLGSNAKFETARDFCVSIERNNIDDIIDDITDMFARSIDGIRDDLYKLYFFDILVSNIDRTPGNWGIKTNSDGSRRLCILDNENAFWKDDSEMTYLTSLPGGIVVPSEKSELAYFIIEHNEKYYKMFKDMYEKLNVNELIRIIGELEQNGIAFRQSDIWICRYKQNYENIKSLFISKEQIYKLMI